MKNIDVRQAIAESRFKHFEVAESLGITENSFSRLLRKELPPEEKQKIIDAIERLMKGGGR